MDGSKPRSSAVSGRVKCWKSDDGPRWIDSPGGGDHIIGDVGYKSDDGSKPIGAGDSAIGSGDNPMGDEGAASREGPACDISISVCPAEAVWGDKDE